MWAGDHLQSAGRQAQVRPLALLQELPVQRRDPVPDGGRLAPVRPSAVVQEHPL